MMCGDFSLAASKDAPIVFYNYEYEKELLSSFGLGELAGTSLFESSSECPKPEFNNNINCSEEMSGEQSPSFFDQELNADPCYFLDFAEVDRLLPPIQFEDPVYEPQVQSADVLPGVKKEESPLREASPVRFTPYPVPSGPRSSEPKKKRGRPVKMGSDSKMALYSRQYRELKKSQLAVSENQNAKLARENESLREQLQQVLDTNRRLEQQVQHLTMIINDRNQVADNYVPVAY